MIVIVTEPNDEPTKLLAAIVDTFPVVILERKLSNKTLYMIASPSKDEDLSEELAEDIRAFLDTYRDIRIEKLWQGLKGKTK